VIPVLNGMLTGPGMRADRYGRMRIATCHAVLRDLVVLGCFCNVEIRFPGEGSVVCRHDPDCQLVER